MTIQITSELMTIISTVQKMEGVYSAKLSAADDVGAGANKTGIQKTLAACQQTKELLTNALNTARGLKQPVVAPDQKQGSQEKPTDFLANLVGSPSEQKRPS